MTTNDKTSPSPARPGTGGPAVRLDPLTMSFGHPLPMKDLAFEISTNGVSGFVGLNCQAEGRHGSAIASGSAADYDATIPSPNERHSTGRAQVGFDTVISSLTQRGNGR